MMSKKQWACMLCLHVSYLCLGAGIFYHIERPLEAEALLAAREERAEILKLLHENYAPLDPEAFENLKEKLAEYCGKEMNNITIEEENPLKWDFYHAFFFSYTVISTIGYGNLAPTTSMGRIIMIFYGIIGIPINGILFANLGTYFGNTFRGLYEKYKKKNPSSGDNIDYQINKLGLFGRIVLYLTPGILIFIILPAFMFVIFEGWDFTLSVYYAFVTLTTIGFGDYVAGVNENGFGIYSTIYKVFLICWITFGLGYLVMVIEFLTQGLRSKRMIELEHKLAYNLKATQSKIWHGVTKDVGYLRRILNEMTLMKFKAVYNDEIPAPRIHRSSSCPSLEFGREHSPSPKRRILSERGIKLSKAQSETDLLAINRDETFAGGSVVEPAELLARVVDALGSFRSEDNNFPGDVGGIHGFTDDEILASERQGSGWSIGGERLYATPPKKPRQRAVSEIKVPMRNNIDRFHNNNEWTWTGAPPTIQVQNGIKSRRYGKLSMPSVPTLSTKTNSQNQVPEETNNTLLAPFKPLKRRMSRFFENQINKIKAPPKQEDELSPAEYLKKTVRGRASMIPTVEQSPTEYLRRTARGRASMMPTDELSPTEYLKKTARGRASMMPTTHQQFKENKERRRSRISLPPDNEDVLEQTTVADLIRALTMLHSTPSPTPKRKLGSVEFGKRVPSLISLWPSDSSHSSQGRRFSVNPTPLSERRFSVNPTPVSERRLSINPTPTFERRLSGSPSLGLPPAAVRRRFSLRVSNPENLPPFMQMRSPLVSRDLNTQRRGSVLLPPPYTPNPTIVVSPTDELDNQRRQISPLIRRMSTRESLTPRYRRGPPRENIPESSSAVRRSPVLPEIKINIPQNQPDDKSKL